jgi:hypothetical protein
VKKLGLGYFGIVYSNDYITIQLYSPTIPVGTMCELVGDAEDTPLKKGDKVKVIEYNPTYSVTDTELDDTYWIDDWYMVRTVSGQEYGVSPENLKKI